MLESLYIAASGVQSQQVQLDTISNNLANVNTPAFKKGRVTFQDLLYREMNVGATANNSPAQRKLGVGSAVISTEKIFSSGELKQTENPLDLAIRGDGFFEVELASGEMAYTRNGSMQINNDGELITVEGHLLNTFIRIPDDVVELQVSETGLISAKYSGEEDFTDLGQLELATFVSPAGLEPVGQGLYKPTEESGSAFFANPGDDGVGQVAQGFTEASNVNLVEELINMVAAQRAYEVNSKVIQASDDILGIINNMRR